MGSDGVDNSRKDDSGLRYTRICAECGNEIEEGADFCYFCGATLKSSVTIDENGNVCSEHDADCNPVRGSENPEDSKFREQYEAQLAALHMKFIRHHRLTRREILALAVALIPGAFSVFGLGHLVLKQWSRALMFICMSAIILYVRWSTLEPTNFTKILIGIIWFLIYLRQCTDLFRIIYFPPHREPPKKGDDDQRGA